MAQITQKNTEIGEESEAITLEVLEGALRTQKGRDDIKVKNYTVTTGSVMGDSFMGVAFLVNVIVEENNTEKKYDLFVKTAHRNKILRLITLIELDLFRREKMVYTEIINDMKRLQDKCCANMLGPSVPTYYYSIVESEAPVLILENMQSNGYVMADKTTGLNYEECKLVMREIATFHALSFAMKKRDSGRLKEYKHLGEGIVSNQVAFHLVKSLHASIQVVRNLSTNSEVLQFVDRLAALDLNKATSDPQRPSEPYATICHGDLWCNNLLFKYEDVVTRETADDVKLVDFQLVRYSTPTTDLSYFFYTSTTQSLRREHLKDLLRLYHSQFMDKLTRLHTEFPEFTFGVLENLFIKTMMHGVLSAFMRLPAFLSKSEDLKFNGKTVTDLQQFIINFSEQIPQNEIAHLLGDRLIGVAEDAIEMGVF